MLNGINTQPSMFAHPLKISFDQFLVVNMVIAEKISETWTRKDVRTRTYSHIYLKTFVQWEMQTALWLRPTSTASWNHCLWIPGYRQSQTMIGVLSSMKSQQYRYRMPTLWSGTFSRFHLGPEHIVNHNYKWRSSRLAVAKNSEWARMRVGHEPVAFVQNERQLGKLASRERANDCRRGCKRKVLCPSCFGLGSFGFHRTANLSAQWLLSKKSRSALIVVFLALLMVTRR